MGGKLTTHVLDTVLGCGAGGLSVALHCISPVPSAMGSFILDEGGRATLVPDGVLQPGSYELIFAVADYHRARGVELADPPFLGEVVVRFGVADGAHYHVPLLVSPYGYAIYRGG